MDFLQKVAQDDKSVRTAFIPALLRHLKLVAGPQVRNVGSVSGNSLSSAIPSPLAMTEIFCSDDVLYSLYLFSLSLLSQGNLMMVHNWAFVSDIWTILMACGARLQLFESNGSLSTVGLYGFEKVKKPGVIDIDPVLTLFTRMCAPLSSG